MPKWELYKRNLNNKQLDYINKFLIAKKLLELKMNKEYEQAPLKGKTQDGNRYVKICSSSL